MMNYDNIPEALQTKLRVSILAAIYNGEKDFNTLKDILKTTDGNLSVQLTKLEKFNCLTVIKTISGRKSRTLYSITAYGKEVFSEYVDLLTKSINKQDTF